MKLWGAIAVSILGFFLFTWVAFYLSPWGPANAEPILMQSGPHCTGTQMQEAGSFYQLTGSPYERYGAWLGHGFTGVWQPQLANCAIQLSPSDSSPFYFGVAMAAWGLLSVTVFSYSLVGHRVGPQVPTKQTP